MFSEVFKLLHLTLTIPVTTATAERSFSTLHHSKTYLRSTMNQTKQNNVMILNIHVAKTNQLNLLKMAERFVSVNDMRKTYFRNFCT